jgi:hypothetical protein
MKQYILYFDQGRYSGEVKRRDARVFKVKNLSLPKTLTTTNYSLRLNLESSFL